MPAVRTITRAVNNAVTVSIPEEYSQYSSEVIVLPLLDGDFNPRERGIPAECRRMVVRHGRTTMSLGLFAELLRPLGLKCEGLDVNDGNERATSRLCRGNTWQTD